MHWLISSDYLFRSNLTGFGTSTCPDVTIRKTFDDSDRRIGAATGYRLKVSRRDGSRFSPADNSSGSGPLASDPGASEFRWIVNKC
jgi:hypothetical protein